MGVKSHAPAMYRYRETPDDLFSATCMQIHAKRVTVLKKDLLLAARLMRGNNGMSDAPK